ncbi:Protein of unknown function (DUF2911) [Chitinophaga skermanii]|uniref:DUF2911 family protein n=1 Tax=Chitinophaga skermanii TaxID=331697 RepID=A0A327QS27_9BACT|nr:DUF2911 domain-containing protein [Chitinophaga skermanii]RAJ06758.1 Protein of unknown function (DUF2911) [Chitinophaga skermanii]
MKKQVKFLAVAAFVSTLSLNAMAQGIKMPAPSPVQTVKQDFALSSVEVTYSRPSVKGRSIFGAQEPYNVLWRTGANAATKVTFGEDVKVNGVNVPKGEYALYTIPGANEWTVILNKGIKNWGKDGYKESDDVARFKVNPVQLPFAVETFMINFENIRSNAMNMMLLWETTMVSFEITADINPKIQASIEEGLKNPDAAKRPYWEAANWYFNNNLDINKALEYVNAATASNSTFWKEHLKAKILAKKGDKAAAKATAQKSITMAKEAKNEDYVRLNEKLIASL